MSTDLRLAPGRGLKPRICAVIEEGKRCRRRVIHRGLCLRHYRAAIQQEKLEELGTPKPKPQIRIPPPKSRPGRGGRRRQILETEPRAPRGTCWIRQDGVLCGKPGGRIRICRRHWATAYRRQALDRLSVPLRGENRRYLHERRPRLVRDECAIVEIRILDGARRICREPPSARGLCRRHYGRLLRQPAAEIQRLGLAERRDQHHFDFERRSRLVVGQCIVVQIHRKGGRREVCRSPVLARGLCARHYDLINKRRDGSLDRIGLKPIPTAERNLPRGPRPKAGPKPKQRRRRGQIG